MPRKRKLKKKMGLSGGFYAPAVELRQGRTPLGFAKMELSVKNDSERKFVEEFMSDKKRERLARKAAYEEAVRKKADRR